MSGNNVVSVRGGKVHFRAQYLGDHVFPACRTGAMTNSGTKYRTTEAAVDCKTCSTYDAKVFAEYRPVVEDEKKEETMPPKKKTEAAPAEPVETPAQDSPADATNNDVDALISDVHATVDQIKAIDPASEGAHTAAAALKGEAEDKIRALPTKHRNTLRAAVNDAFKVATTKPEPAPAPQADATPSTEIAKVSDDPNEWENVPALIALGVEKMKEGVDAGLQLTSAGEVVAKVLLTIRQNMVDPETKLPDLPYRMKATRNAASDVYSKALEGVAEDDIKRRDAHESLQKATQNKASDVLVDWLRSYDADNEESMGLLREIFPAAADAVEKNKAERAAKGEDADDAPAILTPEQAIRNLYAQHDIELPLRGRTEQMRVNRRVEKVKTAVKELEAAKESNNAAKVEELEGTISDLKADLPADALEKLGEVTAEKSDMEKTSEALERAWKALESAGKRAKKVKNPAQKRKIKTEMYAKIREMAAAFELDLTALIPADESGE